MFKITTVEEAVSLIKDGDCIFGNGFLSLAVPEAIHDGITARYRKTGSPNNLTIVSAPGFGFWDTERCAEPYIREGAVRKIVMGHFGCLIGMSAMIPENKFEMYNIPLGEVSHAIRAQAGGRPGCLSRAGVGIYVDPRVEGPGLNDISTDKSLVHNVEIEGEEFLYYTLPKINVAILKGTAADPHGNISFEGECIVGDALQAAQAAHANGGKVIVQVDRLREDFARPRDVIVPGILVDAIVVVPREELPEDHVEHVLNGDKHPEPEELQYWLNELEKENVKAGGKYNPAADIICRRAAQELQPGEVVNLGIGIPEQVGKFAMKAGGMESMTLMVESGGIGGLPGASHYFGAVLGADMMSDFSTQFDFYDGGCLDSCFMGGLEVDRYGNVNVHRGDGFQAGVGGFANITAAAPKIVFCCTFSTKGLKVKDENGEVHIEQEGSIPKFKSRIRSISFSAEQAVKRGQKVLYVTERCVFELTERGLTLKEVYPGVDLQKDILDQLEFELAM